MLVSMFLCPVLMYEQSKIIAFMGKLNVLNNRNIITNIS